MRKWTILATIIIIGTAVAVGVWFFVKISTENTDPEQTVGGERRTFVSFFGEQFGFLTPTNDQPFATSSDTVGDENRPSFRETLFEQRMAPLSDEMVTSGSFVVTSTTTATTTESGEVVTTQLTEEFVRFVERETGHINDFSLTSGATRRVSNTTVPGVQEAFWGDNGSAVVLRYLSDDNETIETFAAPLSTEWDRVPEDLVGTFFAQNIGTITVQPETSTTFYMTNTTDQGIGRTATILNENQQTVFVSPLKEWLASWGGANVILTNKPSYTAVGVTSRLDINGSLTRIVSGYGLTALPNPSGTRVLYATGSGTSLDTNILTINGQTTYNLPIKTLPEKCAWLNDDRLVCGVPNTIPAGLPDSWYQGRISFTDTIWTIDAAEERVNFLYAPEDTAAETTMDITNIAVSDDGTIISFINKKDLMGWVADISQ